MVRANKTASCKGCDNEANCRCFKCLLYYVEDNVSLSLNCKKRNTRYGCSYKENRLVKCSRYQEINWVDKIKYSKKLGLFKKLDS